MILFVIWCYICWQGTKFDQLFSSRNVKILCTLGGLDILLNFSFMVTAYFRLDTDANEVWIMILCVLLCELSIYFRYLAMSFKASLFSHLLKDFDLSVMDKETSLEEAVKANLNGERRKKKSGAGDLAQFFLTTPNNLRRKLTKSDPNTPKMKERVTAINTSTFEDSPERVSISSQFDRL